MMASPRIKTPVTVIGGFLGAGKTTYLNHLLRSRTERYAVLVNDFGAVNIDAALIAKHDGETMTLTNGCVCCSIGSGFLDTLGRILDGDTVFDHIIIEASGVGDPWRIAEIALVEPSLKLNAVIVMADASRIRELIQDPRVGDTVRGQFDRCNLILLNKVDLLDRVTLDAARSELIALRPGIAILETTEHTLPGLPDAVSKPTSRFAATVAADHEGDFRRWSYHRDGMFDRGRLEAALAALPPQLLRLKGPCSVEKHAVPQLLQMVGQDWVLTPVDEHLSSKNNILLVGIGTAGLPPADTLDAILDSALITSFTTTADINHRDTASPI